MAGDIYLFKNNTDSAGNSYGCHENYLVTRAGEFATISDMLLPFLDQPPDHLRRRQGASPPPRARRTAVSQRADHIWEGVSSATTRSRPIINTRDEPHADAEHYRRLHVIVGDSNMSETTTMLKVGSCDLVLRMIEAGRGHARPDPGEPDPRHPRDLRTTPPGAAPCGWPTAAQLSALDLQREYYAKAVEFVAREGSTDPLHAPRARPLGPHADRRRERRPRRWWPPRSTGSSSTG